MTKRERWERMVEDRRWRRDPDQRFLMSHWHPITLEEAQRIRPSATLSVNEQGEPYGQFYRCDQFDAERRLCKAQDKKPAICRNFPWYEGYFSDPDFYSDERKAEHLEPYKRCSFWADVPREFWPGDVDPLPSPDNSTFVPVDTLGARSWQRGIG
jgi:Fe-S-cluster containining protein